MCVTSCLLLAPGSVASGNSANVYNHKAFLALSRMSPPGTPGHPAASVFPEGGVP